MPAPTTAHQKGEKMTVIFKAYGGPRCLQVAELHIIAREKEKMERMMATFAKYMKMEVDSFQFQLDGHDIKDGETPASLIMLDKDVVEAFIMPIRAQQ